MRIRKDVFGLRALTSPGVRTVSQPPLWSLDTVCWRRNCSLGPWHAALASNHTHVYVCCVVGDDRSYRSTRVESSVRCWTCGDWMAVCVAGIHAWLDSAFATFDRQVGRQPLRCHARRQLDEKRNGTPFCARRRCGGIHPAGSDQNLASFGQATQRPSQQDVSDIMHGI